MRALMSEGLPAPSMIAVFSFSMTIFLASPALNLLKLNCGKSRASSTCTTIRNPYTRPPVRGLEHKEVNDTQRNIELAAAGRGGLFFLAQCDAR